METFSFMFVVRTSSPSEIFSTFLNIIILIFGYKFNLIEFIIGMILFAGGYILSAKYLKGE